MKLISKSVSCDEAEYVYDYKGYIIKEYYFKDEDCMHHFAAVYQNNEKLTQFKWYNCLEEAIEYVNRKVKK